MISVDRFGNLCTFEYIFICMNFQGLFYCWSISYLCSCNICFVDKNECLMEGLCKNGGTCVDTEGSYKCKCVIGWDGQNCDEGTLAFYFTKRS